MKKGRQAPRNKALELFRDHPTINRILVLKHAREVFTRSAEMAERGETTPLEGYSYWDIVNDVNQRILKLAESVRIDGEPLVPLI